MKDSEVKYTLVMHSGGGYAGKPGFKRAVEERSLHSEAQIAKVRKAGGLVLDGYGEAADRAEKENYPRDTGMYPAVRGRFSRHKIDGLAIYIPAQEGVKTAAESTQ